MVFVLYLAGLAVLIVVLALGLEFVQRRGAPAVSSPLRQEPVVAPRTPALIPAGANDRTTLSVKRELIDWDVLYGTKILVVPGCYAYRTGGQTHHSAFCFFYQHGFSNPNDWAICQGGNYAD